METDGNKEKVRRLYEQGFNNGNPAVVEEVFADNFVYRNPIAGWEFTGGEAIAEMKSEINRCNGKFSIREQIAEGESVATRYRLEQGESTYERVTVTHFATGEIQEYLLFAEITLEDTRSKHN